MNSTETSTEAIARRLIATRLALGFESQVEFCRVADIAANAWNNYETARSRPKLAVAIALCERFHLTLDWIYRGDASGLPHRLAVAIREPTESHRASPHPG